MKTPPKPKRNEKLKDKAVIYARYSSHNQKDISIEQQITVAKNVAEEYDLTIIETYSDRAISGRSDNRPAFQKMLRDAEKGLFRYVVSWKSSRIGRNMMEAMINETRLAECGVRILYAEEDFEDNAAGRFAARSMMNVNQFYSEAMAEDIRRGMQSNADNCMVTGQLPLGYKASPDLHYEIDEPNAEIVREIFRRVAEGESYAEIARSLNERGIRTLYGNEWNKGSFHRLLANERYRGVYLYKGQRTEGGIPRIISDELFYKVQEVISTKTKQGPARKRTADYLLTGKLFCGKCGAPMFGVSGTSKSSKMHYYYCCKKARVHECSMPTHRRDDVEKKIGQAILDNVMKPDVIEWIADAVMDYQKKNKDNPEIALLESRLADVQLSLNNIMKAIEAGIFNTTTKDRMQALETDKAEIEEQLAAARYGQVEISREYVVHWLTGFANCKVENKKHLQTLFDSFLLAAYIYDTNSCKVVFGIDQHDKCEIDLTEVFEQPPLGSTNVNLFEHRGLFILNFRL